MISRGWSSEVQKLRVRLREFQSSEGELLSTIAGNDGPRVEHLEELPPTEIQRWLKILSEYRVMLAPHGLPSSALNEWP